MNAEQIAKLPKWAQAEIGRLEDEIGRLEQKVRTLQSEGNNPETSTAFLVHGVRREDRIPLGKHAIVDFKLGDETISVRVDDRPGDIYLSVMGSYSYEIRPQSSNYVHIRSLR